MQYIVPYFYYTYTVYIYRSIKDVLYHEEMVAKKINSFNVQILGTLWSAYCSY